MWAHIEWTDGSNPFIVTDNARMQRLAESWDLELVGLSPARFVARERKAEHIGEYRIVPNDYQMQKRFWRDWFIEFSDASCNFDESWMDVVAWGEFAEYIARKFGLVREFRENGIL